MRAERSRRVQGSGTDRDEARTRKRFVIHFSTEEVLQEDGRRGFANPFQGFEPGLVER